MRADFVEAYDSLSIDEKRNQLNNEMESSYEILKLIKQGEFDATDIITHKLKLDEGKHAYEIFDKKLEDCIKVILKP